MKISLFKRWSIESIRDRLFEIPGVTDVLPEQATENRYLVHLFVHQHTDGLNEQVKKAVGRLPNGTKVDIIVYPEVS